MMRIVLGALALLWFLAQARTIGGGLLIYAPYLLHVLLPTFLLTCFAHGYASLRRAIKHALSVHPPPPDEAQADYAVLQTARNCAAASGAAGSIMGMVTLLMNLSDPSALGPALALVLLCAFYGIFIAELIVAPMARRLIQPPQKHPAMGDSGVRGTLSTVAALGACCLGFGVIVFSMGPYMM